MGNYSGPMTISATDAMPTVVQPIGPSAVCTWGMATTTVFSTNQSGGGTDVTDYQWFIQPPTSGTLNATGPSCEVTWNPLFSGTATLSCTGIDACGAGPASNENVDIDPGNSITEQPQDVVVDL